MKIAIIGAGWYGCHIASILKSYAVDITIFEQEDDIFKHASSKNQNRLHLGFHYPRSSITRLQSKQGFKNFKKEYDFCCSPISKNFYAVDNQRSLIDFETFKIIMEHDLDFKIKDNTDRLQNLSGLINTKEEVINFDIAIEHFKELLSGDLRLNCKIENADIQNCDDYVQIKDENFDYLINCTWATFRNNFNIDAFYESCIVLLYKTSHHENDFAITIMDGEFVSLFPYTENGVYTLTSVKNTVLKRDKSYKKIIDFQNNLSDDFIQEIIKKMEAEMIYYYPDFLIDFEFKDYFLTTKSKLNVQTDSREVVVKHNNREIFVFSGKIDTIFEAEKEILKILGLKNE